jgi:hypothetical protein
MTSVDILLFIQRHWKDGYKDFPNLRGLSPAQVLAQIPEKDTRYQQGERGLRTILRGVM